jgi:APA family basic amino acid/polyamine antiporter
MLTDKKISFFSAIFININIVVGSAFFLGASQVCGKTGYWAPVAWLLCAALLAPLVMIFSRFAHKYPEAGGIYVYSEHELGRFWGYLGAWLYFVGTTAGNALVLRAFTQYLCQITAIAQALQTAGIPQLGFEIALALFFTLLSLRNIQLFERTQAIFTFLKVIPFLALTAGALALFAPANLIQANVFDSASLLSAMPMILFAFIGIEACSAIIDKVDNARQKGFKVILASFAVIATIYALAQLLVVGVFGQEQVNPFLEILPRAFGTTTVTVLANKFVFGALLASFCGGFYGLFYVNSWNLFVIAKQKSIAGHALWSRLNAHQSPYAGIGLQATLLIAMLVIARTGDLLLAMSDLGVLLAYLLTAIAFVRHGLSLLGLLGIGTASIYAIFLLQEVHGMGWLITVPFWIICVFGLILYRPKK